MKKPFYRSCLFWAIPAILLISTGLSVYATNDGVIKLIKEAVSPVKSEEIDGLITHLPKDTILVNEDYQGGVFWTESRKNKISRFKCSVCHNNKEVLITNAAEIAHGDISLIHGTADKSLNCFTCHNKDDRDLLVSENNLNIDMDHSYQMCGKCHFRQKKDWIGGAHGKRIDNWAGERAIMNCTSCHNPHSPRFKKRLPKTYSPPVVK